MYIQTPIRELAPVALVEHVLGNFETGTGQRHRLVIRRETTPTQSPVGPRARVDKYPNPDGFGWTNNNLPHLGAEGLGVVAPERGDIMGKLECECREGRAKAAPVVDSKREKHLH